VPAAPLRRPRPTTQTGAPPRTRFLSLLDFTAAELERCLALAADLKCDRLLGRRAPTADALGGLHFALLFEKPSLRTRVTFEVAIRELGAHPIDLPASVAVGGREPIADVARNLERWVHGVVIRTSEQARMVEFATAAPRLPVINALTNEEHPCQALADLFTLGEHWGSWLGRTIAFVGDGNNVATSLVHGAVQLGVSVRVASPAGYELPQRVVREAQRVARFGARLELVQDPAKAVDGVDAVYTDVWTSMGQEAEADARRVRFAPFQVNPALIGRAAPHAVFMHCLPAHRGEEVTDEVLGSHRSVVFDQAENRLHTEKALLLMLVGNRA
jgi:ornithine carbamoyltransferase